MDIKLDTATGDIDLSTGDLVLIDGPDAISQHIRIRIRFFFGEWYIDQRIGIPYFQQIFVKGTELGVVRAIFQKAIATTPGVLSVEKLELVFAGVTRVLTVSFDANIVGADTIIHFDEELII